MVAQDFVTNDLSRNLEEALLAVDRLKVREILTRQYPGLLPHQVVEGLVVPALEHIGAGWENGTYSLSQVYMSGRICEEVVDLILPEADPERRSQPKIAIGVLDDYHMLGKRIVYSTLRASGFELLNYGRMDVTSMARQAVQDHVKILLVSVLMLPSALRIKELRSRIKETDSSMKIVVGGAPFRFDHQLWREVGADTYGDSAVEAVGIIRHMITEVV
jgi:methanogenic corrinoid protein MtbC1